MLFPDGTVGVDDAVSLSASLDYVNGLRVVEELGDTDLVIYCSCRLRV